MALQEILPKFALNLRQRSNVIPILFTDAPAGSRRTPIVKIERATRRMINVHLGIQRFDP